MKIVENFLIFLLLNMTAVFCAQREMETKEEKRVREGRETRMYLVECLGSIYFNSDPSKSKSEESPRCEHMVDFLINLYSSPDIKLFRQVFDYLVLNRPEPDPITMFMLEQKGLLQGNKISPFLKNAFELCKEIVKSFNQDHVKERIAISLSYENVIRIMTYALVFSGDKNTYQDSSTFRSRKRHTLGTLRLNMLVPFVKAGGIRPLEDILFYMAEHVIKRSVKEDKKRFINR